MYNTLTFSYSLFASPDSWEEWLKNPDAVKTNQIYNHFNISARLVHELNVFVIVNEENKQMYFFKNRFGKNGLCV